MEELKQYYYSPSGYQKGISAARKLHQRFPKISIKDIQHWLNRQPVYQIYKPKPKNIKFPHYDQDKPNNTHQADLLFLTHDKKFKYALTVIDIASRYKEAEPLKTKRASEVSEAIQRIYDRSPLDFPERIMLDLGHEFMGEFISLMKKHSVKITRSLNKKKVAFVERFNETLSERLFAHQYAEEIKEDKTNREWVDRLPGVIEALNNEETRMIEAKPIDAIKLDSVKQPTYDEDQFFEELPIDSIVRFLYKPGEEQNDNKYRATDPIWSVYAYRIDEINTDVRPSLYTLQGLDQERTFTIEQLQAIPPDTEDLNL